MSATDQDTVAGQCHACGNYVVIALPPRRPIVRFGNKAYTPAISAHYGTASQATGRIFALNVYDLTVNQWRCVVEGVE